MPGYADRLIRREFPDLTCDGDPVIYVSFRNPRLVPPSILSPEDVPTDAHGQPLDPKQAERAMHASLAVLIKDWHVYDAADDSDDPPLLSLPATAELVAKLPVAIVNAVAREVGEAVAPH